MRKVLPLLLSTVLLVGSVSYMPVYAKPEAKSAATIRWGDFSEKSKINKLSPYLKSRLTSGTVQVIVETNVQPLQNTLESHESVQVQQKIELDQIQGELTSINPKIKVLDRFNKILTGFTVSVPRSELSKVSLIEGVKSIYPVLTYKALGTPSTVTGANKVWGMKDSSGASVTGKGVKVGIIDTGIDYTHPDLKANYKGGYNVVAKTTDPMDGQGHGTHVAGIIAGNGKMKGIAPEASIYSYRVLNNQGMGTNSDILAGIEKAIEDKVDVMNLSLGSDENTPDDPLISALNRASQLGITVVVANGNAGGERWTVGTPATAEGVISVGASSVPGVEQSYSLSMVNPFDREHPFMMDVNYLNKNKMPVGTRWEIVDVGSGGSMEDYRGKDVRGKMVWVNCDLSINPDLCIANAEQAGAAAIISDGIWVLPASMKKTNMAIFSAYNLELPMSSSEAGVGAGGASTKVKGSKPKEVDAAAGDGSEKPGLSFKQTLKRIMKAGNRVISLKQNSARTGEEVAYFSSRGMVQGTWAIKPDVVAPGVHIRSCIPKGKYASWDGTSMAAPQVAGAVALLRQMHPDWNPIDMKSALSNTAKDLINPATGKSYMVKEQGAGRIDIPRAIHTSSLISPDNCSFGLIKPKSGEVTVEKKIVIKNISGTAKTYHTMIELVNGLRGTKADIPAEIKVDAAGNTEVPFKLTIDSSMPRSIYTGRLYVTEGLNQYVIPFTFCIDPKSYQRINYLSLSERFISPKNEGAKSTTEVSYYIPNTVKYTTLYLSGEKLKPTIIREIKNATSGWQKFTWDGTLNGELLPDGMYSLDAVARDDVAQASTNTSVFLYHNGPKITANVDQEGPKINVQVENELSVLSRLFEEDLVKIHYKLQDQEKWIRVPIRNTQLVGKKIGLVDIIFGGAKLPKKIGFEITPPYSWMKGSADTVTVRVIDEAGNRSQLEVKVPR